MLPTADHDSVMKGLDAQVGVNPYYFIGQLNRTPGKGFGFCIEGVEEQKEKEIRRGLIMINKFIVYLKNRNPTTRAAAAIRPAALAAVPPLRSC